MMHQCLRNHVCILIVKVRVSHRIRFVSPGSASTMFASRPLGQAAAAAAGSRVCFPPARSTPAPSRISSVRVSAFISESEPASFMPSSTYASLPKARVKRRVPLPALPIADEATRHCILSQVACSAAGPSDRISTSRSDAAPPAGGKSPRLMY